MLSWPLSLCQRTPAVMEGLAATGRTFISARSESRMPLLQPLAWPSPRALSHALWHGRSVRAQLLIVFIVIDLIAGLVAGAVTLPPAPAAAPGEGPAAGACAH